MDDAVSQLDVRLVARPERGVLDTLAGQGMKDPLASPIHQAVPGQKLRDDLLELSKLVLLEHSSYRNLRVYLASGLRCHDS